MKNKWCCTARRRSNAVVFYQISPRPSVLRFRLTRRYFWHHTACLRPRFIILAGVSCILSHMLLFQFTAPLMWDAKKETRASCARVKIDPIHIGLSIFRSTWFMLVYAAYRLCSSSSWFMYVEDNIWAIKTLKIALWSLSIKRDGACNSALVSNVCSSEMTYLWN